MKVKTVELKGNKGVLKIEDTDVYFVNSLRRIMLAELPKLAIEDVIIYDNTSALFDELISHRLGLVPIPTIDLPALAFRSECKCEGKGCPSCTVRYTLSKEGECVVYSGDLQPEHPSFAITETLIPIVDLMKDQRVILEVEAVLGRGRDHAKWQVVLAPRYRMETKITVDKKRMNEVKSFIEELPKGLVELKGDKLELLDPTKASLLESYMDKNNADYITITKDPTKLLFSFETDGSMSAKTALQESVNILTKKYEEFRKNLKDL
ncbi:MAG TPA: DNA-directed RNA polymerase subunit D [Candidatus Thermoplasmatota archaeon]|nr:DNA-directed RNA polymerase subunit D [Candidatus Thermoplasmatota archaeon]